ncbi:MAG: DUF4292 domain-containing protein [Flavobacterium sp.]|nr:DUF4292 domain-containing protein [Flavobacterium sp.]
MLRYIIVSFLALAMASCKSAASVAEGEAGSAMSSSKIIAKHYANKREYRTMYIKATARYEDERQTQNVTADIRIIKDEAILVSIRFFGITMAKALITPSEVKYYEKINSEFFEGDFTTLSRWLGTDLDFYKVQNMLTGEALDNLNTSKLKSSVQDKMYKLESDAAATNKAYYFEARNFLIKKQEIFQPAKNRGLTITYPGHQKHGEMLLPAAIQIDAVQDQGKTNININYTAVTINEEFTLPYSVPSGYEQIFIKLDE